MRSQLRTAIYWLGSLVFIIQIGTVQALPEDCLNLTTPATFVEPENVACLQKVIVTDGINQQFYKASLQWQGINSPNQFRLASAELDQTGDSYSPVFSSTTGLLTLPKIDIPRTFGTERYAVNLTSIPNIEDPSTLLFELTQIDIYINPDFIPGQNWKPYGMLQTTERQAVDTLGRSIPYAQLADAVYDFDIVNFEQWELIEHISKSSGMQAGLYKNKETAELVLAFRGTEKCDFPCSLETLRDMAADVTLTLGLVPDQFKHAFNFAQDVANRYSNHKITVAGHSLGGGLAQAIGSVFGLETYAFNSSPVPDDFFDQYPVTLPQEELDEIIFNIADIHDPVSNTDENGDFYLNARHITQLFQFNFDAMEIFPTQSFDFTDLRFDRHSITKLIGNAQRLIALYQSGW